MSNVESKATAWLSFIETDHSAKLLSEVVSPFNVESIFSKLLNESNTGELAPFNPFANSDYIDAAKAAETPGSSPISVYDGLQTTINMCRAKSGYNPLDQSPGGAGDGQHFINFTKLVAGVPFITLDWSNTVNIDQKSHDANILIDSFVNGFKGIQKSDIEAIRKSVVTLVQAALSYSSAVERQSIFTQNIFSAVNEGGELSKVTCIIYSSTFEISQTSNKGTVTFHSSYQLSQASYSLAKTTWERIQNQFKSQEKETIDDWLNNMATPINPKSKVRAICLET